MLGGICIIFLLGTITYCFSAPDPLQTLNINLNFGEGTNKGYGSDYFGGYGGGYGYGGYGGGYGYGGYGYGGYEPGAGAGVEAGIGAGFPSEQSSEKHCKADNDNGIDMNIGDGRIYAGFFTRSYGTSGKITFNICKKGSTYGPYDCSHPGGEIAIFGGSKERPYISTLPTKIDITDNAKKAGITKVDDVRFYVTSIQDIAGNKIEKEVFQFIRVFRPKIGCYDFYTIFFNTSVIQPPAIEIPRKVKFKIESPNKKIFQVNTEDDYKNCNEQKFFCMDNKYQLGYDSYKCNIGTGSSTKKNNGNIGNGNDNIKKSKGSYYLFDKDGLPKSCAGGAASNGSKVQIMLTEFAHESGKYIGSGNKSGEGAPMSKEGDHCEQNEDCKGNIQDAFWVCKSKKCVSEMPCMMDCDRCKQKEDCDRLGAGPWVCKNNKCEQPGN